MSYIPSYFISSVAHNIDTQATEHGIDDRASVPVAGSAARYARFFGTQKAARMELQAVIDKTSDGKGIVRKGGFASSALLASSGASQLINAALVSASKAGVTLAELHAAAATSPNVKNAETKVSDHIRGIFIESDLARLRASGLYNALRQAGFVPEELPAVTIDGIEWNGQKFKKSTLPTSRIASPLLCAVAVALGKKTRSANAELVKRVAIEKGKATRLANKAKEQA